VQPFSAARASKRATSARLWAKFAAWKRGCAALDLRQIGDGAGEKAPTQRRIGYEADPQCPRRLARVLGFGAVEQREFRLHRGDGMHRVGAADRLGLRLRQAEMADLALLDQPRHPANRLLDRHRGIDAMLVVEVDGLDAQPLQAGFAGLQHVVGPPVDAICRARLRRLGLAELGGEHDAVAPSLDGAADQRLVVAPAIHVGAVEMGDAKIDGPADQVLRCRIVGRAVDTRQRHATQPDRADPQAVRAQTTLCHVCRRACHRSPFHSLGPRGSSAPARRSTARRQAGRRCRYAGLPQ
jgi:hypothetical protein